MTHTEWPLQNDFGSNQCLYFRVIQAEYLTEDLKIMLPEQGCWAMRSSLIAGDQKLITGVRHLPHNGVLMVMMKLPVNILRIVS